MMNEYIFNRIDYENDNLWVIKDFFNSLNLSERLVDGVLNIIHRTGFVINETYCHFPDLDDPDPECHFDGIMFGVWEGEVIVPESVGFEYVRLACEKYLQLHPEDTDKVKALLIQLP
ncbi:TPA: ribonuclease toxin immunity protein CdiI [Yersinia enterocolitica]